MNITPHFLVPFLTAIITATIVRGWVRNKASRLISRFREVGASDQEHAIPLKEIPERQSWIFDRLFTSGVLVTASEGRCFLDEDALKCYRKRNRTMKAVIFVVGLVAFLLSYFILNAK